VCTALSLHVAMQMGPSHDPVSLDLWRMVSEDSDQLVADQSFLLIVRTRHVVTAPSAWDGTRSAGYSEFPAYSQMLTARLPARRAAIYLRHSCYVPLRETARSFLFRLALHVAVEVGPYLHVPLDVFSVWPLRILSNTSSIDRRRCLPS
jgi:hypothetical protein